MDGTFHLHHHDNISLICLLLVSHQIIFRFIHHASARSTDCSMAGDEVHPSVKAFCVCILSMSLSSVLNLKYKTKSQYIQSIKREGQPTGKYSDLTIDVDLENTATPTSPPPSFNNESSKKSRLSKRKVNISERSEIASKQQRVLTKAVITPAEKSLKGCAPVNCDVTTQLSKSVPETNRTTDLLEVTDLGYSSSYSLTEYFGKELIAALLYEDLRDREIQEQKSQHASSIHGM
jgi:hypothetical protein